MGPERKSQPSIVSAQTSRLIDCLGRAYLCAIEDSVKLPGASESTTACCFISGSVWVCNVRGITK